MSLSVIIMAAGKGVRMRSKKPKVLHPVGGVPMVEHVVKTAEQILPNQLIVIFGNHGEQLKEALAKYSDITFVHQTEQKGTGHAILTALPHISEVDRVLILSGDVPLIQSKTLKKFLEEIPKDALGFISLNTHFPDGLGRVIRDLAGNVLKVVEEKDATDFEKEKKEINTGIYVVSKEHLQKWLPKITSQNAQKEYYLTDIIKFALEDKVSIKAYLMEDMMEVTGINDKMQLARLERVYQFEQHAVKLMQQGVTLLDPARFDVRGGVEVGHDVVIDINVILEGKVKIGNQVSIGANVIIKNSEIGDNVQILPNTLIEDAVIHAGAKIGPFARIRPGTILDENVHVGNFVEIKKSKLGKNTKANHLSYIGDAIIGQNVNVGAGTITCNYDGKNKFQTIIKDNVFIGSDTQLVAPVTVESGATIGAGTTVVKDVKANQLVHNKIQYRVVENWSKDKSSEKN